MPVPTTVTTAASGLTAAEVAQRVQRGQVNRVEEDTSRPLKVIVRNNLFTRFNAILGVLFVLVLVAGKWQDGLFGGLVLVNALIGIVQEVRAKRTLDRLAVLNAPKASVVRDGVETDIAVGDVVLDDVMVLMTGDQVPADGVISVTEGLEIDESLLTGESDPVHKQVGEEVLSGSIVVAGSGRFQATRVGADAYARRIAADARRFTMTKSELMAGIDQLLRYVTWGLVIIGPLLFWSEMRSNSSWRDAVTGATAGLVGMVPEGLVLLTSVAFGLTAVTLARRKVLVQELPAVEVLARVDVVCLDKTGTLTEGEIDLASCEVVDAAHARAGDVDAALGLLATEPSPNATMVALRAKYSRPDGWERTGAVPFSSARKWSAITVRDRGTWVIGAPEMVLTGELASSPTRRTADEIAATGQRVLVLAHTDGVVADDQALPAVAPLALVRFDERIRPDARETLAYFADQGVTLKVISGDNPRTVSAVAMRVGLEGADRFVDARELPDDPEQLADAVEQGTVFGRVTPQQKRAMVGALQKRGHVVAMTGDGVNDALALKDADIGIAMGSGAAATRAVAQLVLLDGRFAHMPTVVAEGRRVIANVERVANLFVVKNVYSAILSLASTVFSVPFPFLPRHLTIISALTIGIPSFFLALAPNNRRYRPGFLRRVLGFSIPAGVLLGVGVFGAYAVARQLGSPGDQARTAACVALMVAGLWVVVLLAEPVRGWKLGLVAVMAFLFAMALTVPWAREFFSLSLPLDAFVESLAFGAAAAFAVTVVTRVVIRRVSAVRRRRREAAHA